MKLGRGAGRDAYARSLGVKAVFLVVRRAVAVAVETQVEQVDLRCGRSVVARVLPCQDDVLAAAGLAHASQRRSVLQRGTGARALDEQAREARCGVSDTVAFPDPEVLVELPGLGAVGLCVDDEHPV